MTGKRYFTIVEANAMIPELESAFHRIIQLRNHLRVSLLRLKDSGFMPENEDFPVSPPGASALVVRELAEARTLVDELEIQLESIRVMGCVVKGPEDPLVDWWSRKDDEDILLCWELGEKSVAYWHTIEDGYQGRRPVSELE